MVVRGRIRSFIESSLLWEVLAAVAIAVWLVHSTAGVKKPPPPPPLPRVVEVELEATLLTTNAGAIRCAPIELAEAPPEWPVWTGRHAAPRIDMLEAVREQVGRLEKRAPVDPGVADRWRCRLRDPWFEDEVMQLAHGGCRTCTGEDVRDRAASDCHTSFQWTPWSADFSVRTSTVEVDAELIDQEVAETPRVFVARVKPRAWPGQLAARLAWSRHALPKLFELRNLRGDGDEAPADIHLRHRALTGDEALLLTETHSTTHRNWYEEVTGLVDARGVTLVFDRVRNGEYSDLIF